ncbi:MAG: hypothetical protein EXS32_07180 [Opitutus sp.]|nr:hypothetical protein [Opitutus sp.]
MNWLFSNFGLLVFVFVVIQVLRAAMKAAQLSDEHKAGTTETDDQRSMREIQERIRRTIAERRGGGAPPPLEPPAERELRPTVAPSPGGPMLDPFGGPVARRFVAEPVRRVPARLAPTGPTEAAILERQQQLADEMRVLVEARAMAERQAAELAQEKKAVAESETGVLTSARGDLLAGLREPGSLRRAWVLREVLGAPVALR